MKKSFITIFLAAAVTVACLGQISFNSNQAQSPEAATTPVHFAPGVVETAADEYNPAFTPDGKTVFFTRRLDRRGRETIMFSRFEDGKWGAPQNAPFSGAGFFDKEPFVSPDGGRIFFASTRPNGRDAKDNFDIWYVEKTADGAGGWGAPKNLGAEVNSAGYDNYPSVADDGTLYFASEREGGGGKIDLYRSRLVGGVYQKPEPLGDAVNTPATEADPFVAPDQSYLIFCSDRPGGEGAGDLYVSFNRDGAWTAPQPLGKIINTAEFEYTPLVSPDGKTFYFSRGWGEIFQVDSGVLDLPGRRNNAQNPAGTDGGGGAPRPANKDAKYLFYLHGRIVEDQGVRAVSERFGAYEYEKIVEGFRSEGFNVVSEARPAGTDVEKYAAKVADQVRGLLKSGVRPENITVVGASKGAFITMLASTYLRNKNLNFVVIAGCSAGDRGFLERLDLHGNILSIYEKTDAALGTCQAFFDDATGINRRKEVVLSTGLAHGFLYRPLREWLVPTLDWAHYQK